MAFQRSYSKVWWDSDNTITSTFNCTNIDPYQKGGNMISQNNDVDGFHSLDSHHHTKYSKNLSRIQEVEESSKLWKSDSPGSLRSQDSGFSEHDESENSRSASKPSSPRKSQFTSFLSAKIVETPLTVLKSKANVLTPTVSTYRLSLSEPVSHVSAKKQFSASNDLINHIDKLSFMNNNNSKNRTIDELYSDDSEPKYKHAAKDSLIRRRRVSRRAKRFVVQRSRDTCESSSDNDENNVSDYKSETAFVGVCGVISSAEMIDPSTETLAVKMNARSTPKIIQSNKKIANIINKSHENQSNKSIRIKHAQPISFDIALLNGHSPSLSQWLVDLKVSYDHEVISTLQAKSIAHEAFRNFKITTSYVGKIVRQLQCSSVNLQMSFERSATLLKLQDGKREENLSHVKHLLHNVAEFLKILRTRSVFFIDCQKDRKQFDDNLGNIQLILKDLRHSHYKQQCLDLEILLNDLQVLKRLVLITIRLVFEKLIRVIVINIEKNSTSDLVLRANLNMITTLSNCDNKGFASLAEGFLKNHTARVLLLICIEHKLSSVRALALRALTTICITSESIEQFTQVGGIDIINDILSITNGDIRSEPEKREAVSLLTQITAPWHGDDHKVFGLRDSVENIVEGISDIVVKTNCCQTLLLCAASLNNLSRLDATSIYSIMSNETLIKLKEVIQSCGPCVSIFLYEQIIALLSNMSSNKKCYSHLANKDIISFITHIFKSEIYKSFKLRAESEAHRRTIKIALHIFDVLIQESIVGQEIIENNLIPMFSKLKKDATMRNSSYDYSDNLHEFSKDICYLNNELNKSLLNKYLNRSTSFEGRNTSSNKLISTRQESFV